MRPDVEWLRVDAEVMHMFEENVLLESAFD